MNIQKVVVVCGVIWSCVSGATCEPRQFHMDLEKGKFRHYAGVLKDSKKVAAALSTKPAQRAVVQRLFDQFATVSRDELEKPAVMKAILQAFYVGLKREEKQHFRAAVAVCGFRKFVRDILREVLPDETKLSLGDVAHPAYVKLNWSNDASCPYSSYVVQGRQVKAVKGNRKLRVALQPLLSVLEKVPREVLRRKDATEIATTLAAACTRPALTAAGCIAHEQPTLFPSHITEALDGAWQSAWGEKPWRPRVAPAKKTTWSFSYNCRSHAGEGTHFYFRCSREVLRGEVNALTREDRALLQRFCTECLATIVLPMAMPSVEVKKPLFDAAFTLFSRGFTSSDEKKMWKLVQRLPFHDWLQVAVRDFWREKPFVASLIEASRYFSFTWAGTVCEGLCFFMTNLHLPESRTRFGQREIEPALGIVRRVPKDDLKKARVVVVMEVIQAMITDGSLSREKLGAIGKLVCGAGTYHRFKPWFRKAVTDAWPAVWEAVPWVAKKAPHEVLMAIQGDGSITGHSRIFNLKISVKKRAQWVKKHRDKVEPLLAFANLFHGLTGADSRKTKARFIARAKERKADGTLCEELLNAVYEFMTEEKGQFKNWFVEAVAAAHAAKITIFDDLASVVSMESLGDDFGEDRLLEVEVVIPEEEEEAYDELGAAPRIPEPPVRRKKLRAAPGILRDPAPVAVAAPVYSSFPALPVRPRL